MNSERAYHRIHRSLNKPLTLFRVERRLFFLVVTTSTAMWNMFGSFFSGLMLFLALHLLALWATQKDPMILRIALNASRARRRYDPAKFEERRDESDL